MPDSPYDPKGFPPFAVTVDVVILTVRQRRLQVVAIRRGAHPFRGCLALPGGFVLPHEGLLEAARRELHEEAGIEVVPEDLLQVGAYGDPDRDPRMRTVTVAYAALVANLAEPRGGSDAASAALYDVEPLLIDRGAPAADPELALAFDHQSILRDAVDRVRRLVEETAAATRFCPSTFTLGELREVYEAVWGTALDPANFRKRVLKTEGFVEPTGEKRLPKGDLGRLAETYQRGPARELTPPLRRPHTYFHTR